MGSKKSKRLKKRKTTKSCLITFHPLRGSHFSGATTTTTTEAAKKLQKREKLQKIKLSEEDRILN